eukprot:Plantae.Rhodophyta-Rhodochaete_pulchella.ctg12764.p1 GENE.Plantae.Rhodophyta-Rhodochaete_pulchella.ctg12764~~Plantae.Rhodophyta-Rhodochaete_pulchella.ctg12764.p1  ORF type:complete len:291 (-),score=47.87 Plantae.Rhodophyta-Rhodochaete_pulchella.ctg12764:60-932(-)
MRASTNGVATRGYACEHVSGANRDEAGHSAAFEVEYAAKLQSDGLSDESTLQVYASVSREVPRRPTTRRISAMTLYRRSALSLWSCARRSAAGLVPRTHAYNASVSPQLNSLERIRTAAISPSRFVSTQNNGVDKEYSEEEARLAGTKTQANLKAAFASQCMSVVRYEYYAQKAEVCGDMESAAVFRQVASSAQQQAMGHMEFLEETGDPVNDHEIGATETNLTGCSLQAQDDAERNFPKWANEARKERMEDAADWFDMVGEAMKRHSFAFEEERQALEEEEDGESDATT